MSHPNRRQPAGPDYDRHRLHGSLSGASTGAAVPYSTDEDAFAPFRGAVVCVDRNSYIRREHSYDTDGVCLWCSKRKILDSQSAMV